MFGANRHARLACQMALFSRLVWPCPVRCDGEENRRGKWKGRENQRFDFSFECPRFRTFRSAGRSLQSGSTLALAWGCSFCRYETCGSASIFGTSTKLRPDSSKKPLGTRSY